MKRMALLLMVLCLGASAQEGKSRKILFFTKSAGFEHSVIKKPGEAPSHAEKVLMELAKKNGWEVTHSKDGSLFTKESIAKFDAFFFYTTGDLTQAGKDKQPPMSREGKGALLEAIRNGKGFIGSHCAADTFHTAGSRFQANGDKSDPYLLMIGGEFIHHGKQQKTRMICSDPKFPGAAAAGAGFDMMEEWYSFKDYQNDLPRRTWPKKGQSVRVDYRYLDGVCKGDGQSHSCRIKHYPMVGP